jgi:hypothetical protein
MGGGIAALQKKDVLQGALMGAAGGALGGAFAPAAGAAGAAGSGAAGTTAGTATAVNAFEAALPGMAGEIGGVGAMAPMGTLQAGTSGIGSLSASGVPALTSTGGAVPGSGMFSGGIGNFLSQNKFALAGGALGGSMAPGEEPDKPDEGNVYDYGFDQQLNPRRNEPGQSYYTQRYNLKGVQSAEDYDPTKFAANGGIIALAEGGNPQDYRVPEMIPAQTNTYAPNIRRIAPEVAAYNQQMMQRANQQYNINPRPAALQVMGMDRPAFGTAPAVLPSPVSTKPADAGIGGLRFDPVTGRYTGTFEAPGNKKTDLEKMREELDALKSEKSAYYDSGSGGAAAGGLMESYAMGGDIGGRYQSPDDMGMGDRIGAHTTVNMAPHYPMQGMYQGYAKGGISHLGDYSDGGRLLKGPGDGVSDDIPAQIGRRQPARLADGEFVVPARIVSELGNGSTDAGAKRLYAMMDRVQKNRKKSVGKGKVAVDSKAYKHLPV